MSRLWHAVARVPPHCVQRTGCEGHEHAAKKVTDTMLRHAFHRVPPASAAGLIEAMTPRVR